MLVGYARVSTAEQSLDPQLVQLASAGADKVFSEKASGTSRSHRAQLAHCLEFVREGDVLIVTRLDRIARSAVDLHNIIHALTQKGVGFRCTEQAGVDTTTSAGKLLVGMLAAVAEFEHSLRAERQAEGIAKAKADGRYKGRKATIDAVEVRRLLAQGMKPSAIAKQLGIGRASVYRLAA